VMYAPTSPSPLALLTVPFIVVCARRGEVNASAIKKATNILKCDFSLNDVIICYFVFGKKFRK
jgi:hypothetical protein